MRQKTRKTLLLISFLLLPLTFFLLSPFLPLQAAAEAVLGGATIIYIGLFLLSFTLGRAFCGWLCPMSGLQDVCSSIRKKPLAPSKGWIKFLFWIPWVIGLTVMFVMAKRPPVLEFLLMKCQSLKYPSMNPGNSLSITGTCHYRCGHGLYHRESFLSAGMLCWIAPFMISGKKLGHRAAYPSPYI